MFFRSEDEDRRRPLKIPVRCRFYSGSTSIVERQLDTQYLIVVRLGLTAATGYSGALAPGLRAFIRLRRSLSFNDCGVNQVLGVEPDGVRS